MEKRRYPIHIDALRFEIRFVVAVERRDRERGEEVGTDDGYELTVADTAVNGAIHAGAYTIAGSMEPLMLKEPCPACGGQRHQRSGGRL